MQKVGPDLEAERIELLVIVVPDFNLAATTNFIDPFRAANYLAGYSMFGWTVASETGGTMRASNGLELETQPLADLRDREFTLVTISASWSPELHATAPIVSFLRRQFKRGATLASLDTGAFILAKTGVLERHRATVHYEHIDAFTELHPDVDVSEDLFVMDDRVLTCSGGIAATDFALQIIRGIHDDETANSAARYIFKGSIRAPGTRQNSETVEPIGATVPSVLRRAIDLMEANLENPLSIDQLCAEIGLSQRQLSRQFAAYARKTPSAYYRDIRLDRARGLVTQTEMSVAEVALASGFQSHVHFSRAYRKRFGLSPTSDRFEGRVPFEFRAWPMFPKQPKPDGRSST